MSYWLAIGPSENWAFCFSNGNIWGFPARYERLWQSIASGDTLFCYATRPMKGLIGYCVIRSKQRGEHPFFPQETQENRVLWPLRVTLEPRRIIPQEKWIDRHVVIERRGLALQRAFQRLTEDRAKELLNELDKA